MKRRITGVSYPTVKKKQERLLAMNIRRFKTPFLLALYCVIGCAGGLLFREAGVVEDWKWFLFVGGNLFGITSTWVMMKIYACMSNANLANLYASSFSFLLGQLAMWILFHSKLTGPQVVGLSVMLAGIVVCGCGKIAAARVTVEARND